MNIDFEVIQKINDIATGGRQTLTRGQIAQATVDIDRFTSHMVEDRAVRAREVYEEIVKDDTEALYDLEMLDAEKERITGLIREQIKNDTTTFERLFASIEKFFISPPFEGMDDIPYGVGEVVVFSVLEYFAGDDHEVLREKYRDNLSRRIGPANADYWIDIYSALQDRYEGLDLKICSQIAISAMLHQSEKYFDDLRKTALTTDEVSDNAIVLANFVEGQIRK